MNAMDHRDSFVGDRLRLKTFLRVLENGKPKRPSRLKPSNHTLIEASDQNAEPHSAGNVKCGLDHLHSEVNCMEGQENVPPGSDLGPATTQAIENAVRCEKQQNMVVPPIVPPLREPNEQSALSIEAHLTVTRQQGPEEPSATPAKVKSFRKSGKTSDLTRSDKIRPLQMLELRRTGTFEDQFHHHTRAALNDPIEQSQPVETIHSIATHRNVHTDNANVSNMKKGAQRSNVDTTRDQKTVLNPEFCGPQQRRTGEASAVNVSTDKLQICSATKKVKHSLRRSHGPDRDGFTVSELSITPRSVKQRRQPTHKIRKQNFPTRGVALAKGPLPLRLAKNHEADLTTENILSKSGKSSVSKHNMLHSLHEEKKVRDQLSSITAPIRKESESSGSGNETNSAADEFDMVDHDTCFSEHDSTEDHNDCASSSTSN